MLAVYGMINQAVKDLVWHHAGEDTWLEVCREAELDPEGFESLTTYPDSLTFKLVDISAKKLHLTPEQVLRSFGRHWVFYTGEHGYGDVMRMFGKDFRTCLSNLNQMHAHMGALMPQLRPPRFVVRESAPKSMTVDYFSERQGLGPMVLGLLEGLAEKYHETIAVEFLPKQEPAGHDTFVISFA